MMGSALCVPLADRGHTLRLVGTPLDAGIIVEEKTALGLAGTGDLNVTCNGGRTGRFGVLLGRGHSLPRARELMQGATLECLDVLAVLDRYLQGEGEAVPRRAELPLLSQLVELALHGAPLAMPFEEFFRA